MFGQGNVYGETNLQANHESVQHWDVHQKAHVIDYTLENCNT